MPTVKERRLLAMYARVTQALDSVTIGQAWVDELSAADQALYQSVIDGLTTAQARLRAVLGVLL